MLSLNERDTCKNSTEKPERERPLGLPIPRWDDNIKMNVKVGYDNVNSLGMGVILNTVMKLRVS
jgi:hypothetical protein